MNAPAELRALHATLPLLNYFRAVRARSLELAAGLSAEDCSAQSMPDASPVKWHLAHTTWFFETFVLERFEPGYAPHHPAFRMLFNSYYHGVGARHLRAERGLLTRPGHDDVLAYRADVDARIARLCARDLAAEDAGEIATLIALGLQHEQQHQELIVTDLKHLYSRNPLLPAPVIDPLPALRCRPSSSEWLEVPAGVVLIGHDGEGFCFDNELPRHRQFVEPFALATQLVTNGEFRHFIEDGGYQDPALWLSEGWDWLQANALRAPLYWQHDSMHGWQEFTARGLQPLEPIAPLLHVSLYEADAYARWAGAVLPTEGQWEAAVTGPDGGALSQVFDTGWQWTLSSYAPYPGYAPASGALGEYNGKFMINQYVLRGGSQATPAGHTRATYRNFFPASTRWQFTGIRLARALS